MKSARILILGGGIAGAATAWWLARLGAPGVVLLEGEATPGRHSSGLNAAILRSAIGAEPTRRLALESGAFLRRPPADFSECALLDPCGLLIAEGEGAQGLPGWSQDSGRVHSIDHGRALQLAPHWQPVGKRLWHLPDEGRIDITALLDGFLRGARAGGVDVRCEARVRELLVDGETVHGVRLANGQTLEAERVVLAAGGWAHGLARRAGSGLNLEATRRHLVVTAHDRRIDPRWPVVWDDAAGFYARPESGGMLISACDLSPTDPDSLVPDPDVQLLVAEKVQRCMPSFANAGVASYWPGVRTLSPDDVPAIGADPTLVGLSWAAGLGGHGMTISYGLGRVAAEHLLERVSDVPFARAFDPARLALRLEAAGPVS